MHSAKPGPAIWENIKKVAGSDIERSIGAYLFGNRYSIRQNLLLGREILVGMKLDALNGNTVRPNSSSTNRPSKRAVLRWASRWCCRNCMTRSGRAGQKLTLTGLRSASLAERRFVLLLVGGDKSSQRKDIAMAKRYWKEYQEGE